MKEMLSALHSPQLVASFQRLCGVRVVGTEPNDESGSDGKRREPEDSSRQSNGVGLTKRKTRDEDGGGPREESSAGANASSPSSGVKFEVTNKFLYYLFCFGSSLGNEAFYICFFPFWFWNVDGYVGRRLCFFWGLFMYLGQATKDVLRIPRPASPPVVRMEDRYALEYGMPSTHAMVGAGIPFGIYFLTRERYLFPSQLTLACAILWCVMVCSSRCYLGMHSVLDVLVGLAYVFILMVVCFHWSVMDVVDRFVLQGGILSLLLCLLVPLLLCIFYPASKHHWTTARGDTTIIVAVCSGQLISHWLSYHLGQMTQPVVTPRDFKAGSILNQNSTSDPFNASLSFGTSSSSVGTSISPPYPVNPLTFEWAVVTLSRTLLGLIILVVARFLIRSVVLGVVCRLNSVKKGNSEACKSLKVELPYKFTTYLLLTICGLLVCPIVFREFGIERETYFTEL